MGVFINLFNPAKLYNRLLAAILVVSSLLFASMGSVTGTSGSFGSGTWTTVDITPLIPGNGTFSIALTTTNTTAFSLASREAGANAPQLVIETTP